MDLRIASRSFYIVEEAARLYRVTALPPYRPTACTALPPYRLYRLTALPPGTSDESVLIGVQWARRRVPVYGRVNA